MMPPGLDGEGVMVTQLTRMGNRGRGRKMVSSVGQLIMGSAMHLQMATPGGHLDILVWGLEGQKSGLEI